MKGQTMPITTHRCDGRDDNIDILTLDDPGAGGAYHRYQIDVRQAPQTDRETGEPVTPPPLATEIAFQNGPVTETGFNGVTNEALLAIVQHRLECFQQGEFATEQNRKALIYVREAISWLHARTRNRRERGVEGTSRR